MARTEWCDELEQWLSGSLDPAAWRRHRRSCPSCSSQAAVDAELRSALGELPFPGPSPAFRDWLRARVDAGRPAPGLPRRPWRSWGMAAYWAVTGLLAPLLLWRVAEPAIPGLGLLLVLLVAGRLSRLCGVEPVDLLRATMRVRSAEPRT